MRVIQTSDPHAEGNVSADIIVDQVKICSGERQVHTQFQTLARLKVYSDQRMKELITLPIMIIDHTDYLIGRAKGGNLVRC